MKEEEIRDLFSEAYDEELDSERQQAFDAALAAHPALAREYAEFVELFDRTHAMDTGGAAPPNLLLGVQRKLRERSRGRYYRDVFAEKQKQTIGWLPMLVAFVIIFLTALAYFGLHYVQLEEGQQSPPPTAPSE